jgi:uroporphyrin-III C-methyltransferase
MTESTDQKGEAPQPKPTVWLVGAGPGNPELLTQAARERMASADFIYVDRLARPVLEHVELKPAARIIDVGKARGKKVFEQEEIQERLAEAAREGLNVVRLKGGDPFLFGRGGEEAEYLTQRGIHVEAVPGISAHQAAAEVLGIPLTHRDVSSSITYLTTHDLDSNDPQQRGRWTRHTANLIAGETLCIYMGMATLSDAVRLLHESGCPLWMPIALVSKAGWPEQKLVKSTLQNVQERVEVVGAEAPAIIFIGKILRHSWIDGPSVAQQAQHLIVGQDATLPHDDWSAAEKAVGVIATVSLLANQPNIALLKQVDEPRQLVELSLASPEDVWSLKASLAAKEWLPADLPAGSVNGQTLTAVAALRDVLGLRCRHNRARRFKHPTDQQRIATTSASGVFLSYRTNADDGAGVQLREASLPGWTTALQKPALETFTTVLAKSTLESIFLCDTATVQFVLPLLKARDTSALPSVYVTDEQSQQLLKQTGIDATIYTRPQAIYKPASSCTPLIAPLHP